jgi:2-keto-4-pentenoate hydratase/2-oxohepta-3-ene-1,7-dioic acid hydratase in catechol pathway
MTAVGRFTRGNEIPHPKPVDGELFRLRGDILGWPSFARKPMACKGVKTLVPVIPSKIIAVGLNFIEQARETGKPLPRKPLLRRKATTSLIPDGGKFEIPCSHHPTNYEAEPALVIGRKIRNVTASSAAPYIFGYNATPDISDWTIEDAKASARAANRSTPSRLWNLLWKRRLIRAI